jgi:hypothetical protein
MAVSGGITTWSHHHPQCYIRHALWGLILTLTIANTGFALEIPPTGWVQQFDSEKNAKVFQPDNNLSDIIVKYYPKELLEHQDISDWLLHKLTSSKAPRGKWIADAIVIRDTANFVHGRRQFRTSDGMTGYLQAVAVTIDRLYVRLAVAIASDKVVNQKYMDVVTKIIAGIYNDELNSALEEGRGKSIETAPPTVKGVKAGGPIKSGRYVGSRTRYQEVKGRFEIMLYDTGEYELLGSEDKAGKYIYSQSTGRLNLAGDFYNVDGYTDDFCVYGIDEQSGKHIIYARDDEYNYRLLWVNPVDRLSPQQNKHLEVMKKARKGDYPYVTNPGDGIPNDQIETILYTYNDNHIMGGIQTDEEVYLLMKDGRVMDGIPVTPDRLDVAKSRSREPDRWGWWKYDGERYSFAWNVDRNHFVIPSGRQVKGKPIPPGTRLNGEWGASSSYASLDFSSTSFWGVFLNQSGRFKKYRNDMMQAGGEMEYKGPMITTYHDDEGSVTSVIGSNVGGGSRRKNNRPDSDRIGAYAFEGYTLILRYDNGVEKRLVTFATSDDFRGIWFEDGLLYHKG